MGYQAAANDVESEKEALEWCESLSEMALKIDRQFAQEWDWLVDLDQLTILEVSPFGDLFMKDPSGAFCILDINMGEVTYADVAGEDPAELFPVMFDMRIASGYITSGLLPSNGQCFGYKRQLVAGG